MIKPQTLKGFRDFLPKEAKKRQFAVRQLAEVFESFGFEPLETPAMEYEQILLGKYGEEGDQLMYRFIDRGGRAVAMRYDQTVPLARVIAQYQSELVMPFKRYQIQPVWRAENPQKGRFREFMQCDADIVGLDTPLSDAEVIFAAAKSLEALGFKNFKILINDRAILYGSSFKTSFDISTDSVPFIFRSLDKLKKIGEEGVLKELMKEFTKEQAKEILTNIREVNPTDRINQIFYYLEKLGISPSNFEFDPTLARGLNYYTGLIFEIEIEGYTAGSVCGGGRYNNLIGMFAGREIPAVGFAFGFDRLIDAMDQLNLFPQDLGGTKVLVTIFSPELLEKSIEVYNKLKFTLSDPPTGGESKGSNNITTEIYLDENAPLEKQLKYANQKQIPFVAIIGPEEIEKNSITLRNMSTREQRMASVEEIIAELR